MKLIWEHCHLSFQKFFQRLSERLYLPSQTGSHDMGQPIPGRFGEFLYREQEFSSRNQSCFQRRQVKQALIVQGFLRSIIKPAPTSKTIPHQAMVLGISPHTTKPMTTAVSKPT